MGRSGYTLGGTNVTESSASESLAVLLRTSGLSSLSLRLAVLALATVDAVETVASARLAPKQLDFPALILIPDKPLVRIGPNWDRIGSASRSDACPGRQNVEIRSPRRIRSPRSCGFADRSELQPCPAGRLADLPMNEPNY